MKQKDTKSKNPPGGIFANKKFVITGEFVRLSRYSLEDIIKSYGGQVVSAVSG